MIFVELELMLGTNSGSVEGFWGDFALIRDTGACRVCFKTWGLCVSARV